ncbi:MAG: putative bifunctional diguanylate cyclase/phosphodiesterase [Acidiferrobacteraceae bacterium]
MTRTVTRRPTAAGEDRSRTGTFLFWLFATLFGVADGVALRFWWQHSGPLARATAWPALAVSLAGLVFFVLVGRVESAGRRRRERQSELVLEERDHRLSALIENFADPVWLYYFDGRPPLISRELCGYSPQELAQGGLSFFLDLCLPESRLRLEQDIKQLKETGARITHRTVEMTNRSSMCIRTYLVNMSPLYQGGRVVGVQGANRDITEFQSVQKALRQSESRFLDIIEAAHDLVWSVDADGKWTYLNRASTQIYGRPPADLIGRPVIAITHPDSVEEDLRALRTVLKGTEITRHETMHVHSDGSIRHLSFNMKPRLDDDWNVVGAMGTARDVTEQKRYQQQLEHLAAHDALTGLYNRHHFERELQAAVEDARTSGRVYGLLYIDLDNFKYVNDTSGHAAGDRLLVEVSVMQQTRIRSGDVLARFGGDEFTVLLRDVDLARLRQTANSFHELFNNHIFFQSEHAFDIRVSIGATLITSEATNAGDALGQADLACSVAKSQGRNQVHIYDAADLAKADMVSDIGWSRKIHEALEREGFVLWYQPILRVADGQIDQYEVLLRMVDEQTGEVSSPGAFLPAAERFGLIHLIDRWVVNAALGALGDLIASGHFCRFAINLSGRSLQDRELLPRIKAALKRFRVPPHAVTFEVTESAAISRIADVRSLMDELRALGCRFALDDFGTGFSSYGYLKNLPVDYLKIDGSFVQNLPRDVVDQAMVQSMNQIAHALGKKTIAEFVEDHATLELLRTYGVDFAQGRYLQVPARRIADPKAGGRHKGA